MATQSTSTTSGVTRITGTYSGLDVDALVTAGVATDQSKLDKAKQAEQIMEWKQEQYRTIMTDVTNFSNKYLSSTGENSLTMSSDWNAMKATSDNSAVTATASTGASTKNYTVNVNQIATASSYTINSTNADNSTNTDLAAGKSIYIKDSAGKDITITLSGTTKQDIAKNLNSSLTSAGVKVSATYSDFANNGKGGVVLESQVLGTGSKFNVTLAGTNHDSDVTDGKNLNATIIDGSNTYTINDSSTNNKSNSITLDNVTFNFKAKTTTGATVSTTKDTSTVADKLTSFVDDYNTLLKEINGKIYETYDKNYAPLTDAQKKAMTDTQITQWNTKAQTGLLRKDEYLTSLASDMKDAMTTMMSGSGFNLEKLGITPVDDYGSLNGTYKVTDKSKLTSALENNFDKVYQLFTTSTSTDLTKSMSTDGLLAKLKVGFYNNVTASSSKMAKKAGVDGYSTSLNNEMTKAMTDQQTLIDTLEDKLNDKETALYNKYSTLETKLSSLESSSSALSSFSS